MGKRISLSISFLFVVFFLMLLWVRATFAAEIHYASFERARGDEVHISYRGPWGERYYSCGLSTSQRADFGTSTPELYPQTPLGFGVIARSQAGESALTALPITASGVTNVYYSLYDTSGNVAAFKALVPFYKPASRVYFSRDGSSIVFVTRNGELVRFHIPTENIKTLFATQTEFPFLSISHDGSRVSAYNYTKRAAVVWNFNTGASAEIPASLPTYVEFTANGTALFADVGSDFTALYSSNSEGTPSKIVSGNFEIVDFIAVGSAVYYIANTAHPLTWSLYKLDIPSEVSAKGGSASGVEVLPNVSYGSSLRLVGKYLVVSKVSGKNSNVVFIDTETGAQKILEPVGASAVASGITRETLVINKRHAVLLSPTSKTSQNLFIWLHGGPNRQTSVGYHSYLSYAVYDELLENIAAAGNYVLKLDYVGSIGYGNEIKEGLNNNVGKADVADVVGAVREFKSSHSVSNVYAIGNSYGGYLALRALVEDPTLINGAVSVNGVTDWYGLIWRIPSSPFVKYFGSLNNVANITNYLAASVYAKVSSLGNQKMLLFYGEEDSEVPTWQTTQFYDFVKYFGKNAELVSYPGEGHIPKKRATLNDMCARVTNAFSLSGVKCAE